MFQDLPPRPARWTGARQLLKRLRAVMAAEHPTQQKLDVIVQVIATDMVAEVCSLYLRKAGALLELCATQGLRAEAVHLTRLNIGEGLVGDIAARARPLAVADAPAHPAFAYRPETGEELYKSLLGVPILRGGKVLGVLVIQNRAARHYTEEEIETLETIAMVLAEFATGDGLVLASDLGDPSEALLPLRLSGVRLNGGLGLGQAVFHVRAPILSRVVAEDTELELERLATAMAAMQDALHEMLGHHAVRGGEQRDILETYLMFARDNGWAGKLREAIGTGLTAEAAAQKVQNDMRVRLGQATDPYLRERLQDLEDLTGRLLMHLSGQQRPLPETGDLILIARALGPMELLDYPQHRLKGVVLEEGTAGAHVAILARALDVPMVGQVRGLMARLEAGEPLVVDGDGGEVYIRPGDEVKARTLSILARRQARARAWARDRDLPAVTRDGIPIELCINAGFVADVEEVHETGAAGVGLYRTEIPFMIQRSFPDVASQTDLYRKALDAAGDKPVVFRTLDIGGDKTLSYMPDIEAEENPAMGWRALRLTLDRPALFRTQLRALLLAASGRDLHIMFPMVSEVSEFQAARKLLAQEEARLAASSHLLPRAIRVGTMLEVPALLWQLPQLLAVTDFVSVGSNDLLQFIFASDRGSPHVGGRYDPLSPAALTLLQNLVITCNNAHKPLTICGEIAGQPLEAMALVGLGFRRLSMNPRAVGAVRAMVRSLEAGALAGYLATLTGLAAHSVRERLRFYAQDHSISL
jgi:phosphotransferase system, enzyme I, PtsP